MARKQIRVSVTACRTTSTHRDPFVTLRITDRESHMLVAEVELSREQWANATMATEGDGDAVVYDNFLELGQRNRNFGY